MSKINLAHHHPDGVKIALKAVKVVTIYKYQFANIAYSVYAPRPLEKILWYFYQPYTL